MANYLTTRQLIDMEFELSNFQAQVEKLPLIYEYKLRVFLYQTTEYLGVYKALGTRLLQKRYGEPHERKMQVAKGQKAQTIKVYTLREECKEDYNKEMAVLDNEIVPIDLPQFDEKILKMHGVSINKEVLKPFIIQSDAQADNK